MSTDFIGEAQAILDLETSSKVNELGGYGPDGEAIYHSPPYGCPSTLVDKQGAAKAVFMSNGSIDFSVNVLEGMEIKVLRGSYDQVEKREIGPMSANAWLRLSDRGCAKICSLVNPKINVGVPHYKLKYVKCVAPGKAVWFCMDISGSEGVRLETAVKTELIKASSGPALRRQILVRNCGNGRFTGTLWTCFNTHGTQKFAYNKENWYDAGLPLSPSETVAACPVPYTDILQIKRLSSACYGGAKPVAATCDYQSFVGDSSSLSILPDAVRNGAFTSAGAGARLNRFSTPTIAANRFDIDIYPGKDAVVGQILLYVLDPDAVNNFSKDISSEKAEYHEMEKAFKDASLKLIKATGSADGLFRLRNKGYATPGKASCPDFFLCLPQEPVIANYANSAWAGVDELYENCRAHGAMLADGIELGTRDRAQDMWAKMKADPKLVRRDIVHALSFMYRTDGGRCAADGRLSLRQKLHGMFPRQYPSCWRNRDIEVANDNRPYADSALWLLNSLVKYVRETGDRSVLGETVATVRLTNPDDPVNSVIVGGREEFVISDAALEILKSYKRHCEDTPYGMAQILYGDWCDPVDMFGSGEVGNPSTRGKGRGVNVRLSAHLFCSLVEIIDIFADMGGYEKEMPWLMGFANVLRNNIMRIAWEEEGRFGGFIDSIHELRKDGSRPDYASGEVGYTLGSMNGAREFDAQPRGVLTPNAWGLKMLLTERKYLSPIPESLEKIRKLLDYVDSKFFDGNLGLRLFTVPVANNRESLRLVGRLGIIPSGCAENGEYHHAQIMMHLFRIGVEGQADIVWRQLKPMISAMRGSDICGPFETPASSYASDPMDPHYGSGMYFGLSGSIDWMVELFQKVVGLKLDFAGKGPAISVEPTLPAVLGGRVTFKRNIHVSLGNDVFRRIPVSIDISCDKKTGKRIIRTSGVNAVKKAVNTIHANPCN